MKIITTFYNCISDHYVQNTFWKDVLAYWYLFRGAEDHENMFITKIRSIIS